MIHTENRYSILREVMNDDNVMNTAETAIDNESSLSMGSVVAMSNETANSVSLMNHCTNKLTDKWIVKCNIIESNKDSPFFMSSEQMPLGFKKPDSVSTISLHHHKHSSNLIENKHLHQKDFPDTLRKLKPLNTSKSDTHTAKKEVSKNNMYEWIRKFLQLWDKKTGKLCVLYCDFIIKIGNPGHGHQKWVFAYPGQYEHASTDTFVYFLKFMQNMIRKQMFDLYTLSVRDQKSHYSLDTLNSNSHCSHFINGFDNAKKQETIQLHEEEQQHVTDNQEMDVCHLPYYMLRHLPYTCLLTLRFKAEGWNDRVIYSLPLIRAPELIQHVLDHVS